MTFARSFKPVIFVAIISLVAQDIAFALQPSAPSANVKISDASASEVQALTASALRDPFTDAISDDRGLPSVLDIDPHDSSVDADPFFTRSESWSKQATGRDVVLSDAGISAEASPGEISFRMPDQKSVLTIRKDFKPIFQTSEFIFMAGGPSLFAGQTQPGQGIFFISVKQLYTGGKVPVFFYAIPGRFWIASGNLTPRIVREFPSHDLLIAAESDGRQSPIWLDGVRKVQVAQSFNFNTAMVLAAQARLDFIQANLPQYQNQVDQIRKETAVSLQKLVDRSTLDNGGMQLDRYAQEAPIEAIKVATRFQMHGLMDQIFPARGSTIGFGTFLTGMDWDNGNLSPIYQLKSRGFFSQIKNLFSSEAHADPMHDAIFHAVRVLGICAVVMTVSVFLRMRTFRKKIDEAIANGDEAIGKTNLQATLTIAAQAMSFVGQMPGTWSTNLIEYVLDMAQLSEHNIVRILFNRSFGVLRNASAQIRLNHQCVVKGILALGGADVAVTALIQYEMIPVLLKHMDIIFPILHNHIVATSAELGRFSLFQTVSNAVSWLSSGAAIYAGTQNKIATQNGITKASAAMAHQGLNPDDPKNKDAFEALIRDSVKEEMKTAGLPGEEVFLFNAAFVYNEIQSKLGYTNPSQSSQANYAQTRQGLMRSVLVTTLKKLSASGDTEATQVIQSAIHDFSILDNLKNNPKSFTTLAGFKEILVRFRQVRGELSYFTLAGEMSELADVPKEWMARGDEPAALRAAHGFRNTLFERLELAPQLDGTGSPSPVASVDVRDPYALGKTLGEQKTGFGLLNATFERWQLSRAEARADADFLASTGESPDGIFNATADDASAAKALAAQTAWSAFFKRRLLESVALSVPDFTDDAVASVQKKVDTEFDQQMQNNSNLKNYFAGLTRYEQARLQETLKADRFAEAYVTIIRNQDGAPALSPQQPGRFQKLRQTETFKKAGKPAAIAVRLVEGFFPTTRFQRGFANVLFRNIPMLDFQSMSAQSTMRSAVSSGTIGYGVGTLWGSVMAWKKWAVGNYLMDGPLISAEWTLTNQITRNLGFKPGKSMKGMLAYGVIGSFVTWTEGLIFPMFANDIVNGINTATKVVGADAMAMIHPIVQVCGQLFQ